jgi:hypothetical protein
MRAARRDLRGGAGGWRLGGDSVQPALVDDMRSRNREPKCYHQ